MYCLAAKSAIAYKKKKIDRIGIHVRLVYEIEITIESKQFWFEQQTTFEYDKTLKSQMRIKIMNYRTAKQN